MEYQLQLEVHNACLMGDLPYRTYRTYHRRQKTMTKMQMNSIINNIL